MLCDQVTVRVIASTLEEHYREKPLVLVCDPMYLSTSRHAPLPDSAAGPLVDEMLPLATLITPSKSEAELILSQKRNKVTISTLADSGVGGSVGRWSSSCWIPPLAEGTPHLRSKSGLAERWTRNGDDDGGP